MNILDQRFKYRGSNNTDVQETWKKYGWKPTRAKEQLPAGSIPLLDGKTAQ